MKNIKELKELTVEEREELGFFYFENLCKLYNIYQSDEYTIKSMRFVKFCPYDVLVLKHDKETGSIIGRIYIELKIRDNMYDDNKYILEHKKFNRLKKHKEDQYGDTTKYFYINFLPTNTYITLLDNKFINNDLLVEHRYMNKRTFESRTEKVKKKVYMIDVKADKDTKEYNYTGCIESYNACKKILVKERMVNKTMNDLSVLFDKYK